MTRVALIGDGPRTAQLGAEFALGGCSVAMLGGEAERSAQLFEGSLRFAAAQGLAGPVELERARALLDADGDGADDARLTLIVEALRGEALEEKAAAIAPLAKAHPEALVATTSQALGVTVLADAAGVAERAIAMRYGQPPMLVPVVELLAARDTPHRLLDRVSQLLRAIGKRPVSLRRDVAGMIAGRLEVAIARECLWLLRRGVADAQEFDAILRDALARGWTVAGPLAAAALGDAERLERIAAAVIAEPQPPDGLEGLSEVAPAEPAEQLRERRDEVLAAALRAERAAAHAAAGRAR